MKVRIEIDTRTFVRFWLVVIGFAFAIMALYSARTALIIIGTALFLAIALNGPVSRLAGKLPDRSRTLSTAISFAVVVAILSAVVFLVIPPIAQQTARFIESAPELVRDLSEQWKGVGVSVDKYHIQPQVDQAVLAIQSDSTRWAASFGKNFISGVGSALSLFAAILLVLVLTFLMLVEGPLWLERVWGLYRDPRKMEAHKKLVRRMHNVVAGYVTGQLSVAGIGGIAAGATVFILSLVFADVPANLALPTIAITFTLALIPMFGSTIAGVLVSALLAVNNFPAAIIFAVFFIVYQQIENNFISPVIQSKRIELSPLAVLASVTIGLYMFGIAGGIISIPIAGSIKVLIEEYLEKSKHERSEADKPLAKFVKKISGSEE